MSVNTNKAHAQLPASIERRFRASQPRLLRLARLRGVPIDALDDVVQETLIEAWRHLHQLSDPDRFHPWLDGICRNVCRRHFRSAASAELPHLFTDDALASDANSDPVAEIPDPSACDPSEELDRQDLHTLLDRALGYLPERSRAAIELCYLAELPQREAAERLDMTLAALEERLRRTRKQLRQLLTGELRDEAEAFGLALDEEMVAGWRETRIWCPYCGAHRLVGALSRSDTDEPHRGLFLRCPSSDTHIAIANATFDEHAVVTQPFQGMTSFRPMLTRGMAQVLDYYTNGCAQGWASCMRCGQPAQIRTRAPLDQVTPYAGLVISAHCEHCGAHPTEALPGLALCLPESQQFWRRYPRMQLLPIREVEFEGRQALLMTFQSVTEHASLDIISARDTFKVLANSGALER